MMFSGFVTLYKKPKKRGGTGDVFVIPVAGNSFCIGVLDCNRNIIALNKIFPSIPNVNFYIESNVLFRVIVYNGVVGGKHGWKIIGNVELPEELISPAKYLHQAIASNDLFVYQDGVYTPISADLAVGMEKFAVWDDYHVIDRLNACLSGVPCVNEQHINRIIKYDPVTLIELPDE